MFRLPVSHIEVELRPPTGADDMLLLEGHAGPVAAAIGLAGRLARHADGTPLDAAALALADLEALMLELRRWLLGDVVQSRARCPVEGCGAAIDISFRVSDYLAHRRVRLPAGCEAIPEDAGWFRLRGGEARFRLVTGSDVAAALETEDPERELARRTIAAGRKFAMRAMEAMAPPFSGDVEGRCPECGATAQFWFDSCAYVVREMRYDAEFLYQDVHLLASRYRWAEDAILSLPRGRRARYAEMVLNGAGGD